MTRGHGTEHHGHKAAMAPGHSQQRRVAHKDTAWHKDLPCAPHIPTWHPQPLWAVVAPQRRDLRQDAIRGFPPSRASVSATNTERGGRRAGASRGEG